MFEFTKCQIILHEQHAKATTQVQTTKGPNIWWTTFLVHIVVVNDSLPWSRFETTSIPERLEPIRTFKSVATPKLLETNNLRQKRDRIEHMFTIGMTPQTFPVGSIVTDLPGACKLAVEASEYHRTRNWRKVQFQHASIQWFGCNKLLWPYLDIIKWLLMRY